MAELFLYVYRANTLRKQNRRIGMTKTVRREMLGELCSLQHAQHGSADICRIERKKSDADEFRDKIGPEARHRPTPVLSATITIEQYLEIWKSQTAQQ